MKKLIKDWKLWVVLICGAINIGIDLVEKDWTEALWVFVATALFITGKIQNLVIEEACKYIDTQDELLSEADVIIRAQTDLIKELEEKINEKH